MVILPRDHVKIESFSYLQFSYYALSMLLFCLEEDCLASDADYGRHAFSDVTKPPPILCRLEREG